MREDYNCLTDDWAIIERGKAFPMPKRIRIFDYNLKHKEIAKRVLGFKRLYYYPLCKLLEYGSRFSPHKIHKICFQKITERTMLTVDIHRIYPEAKVSSPHLFRKYLLERKVNDIK